MWVLQSQLLQTRHPPENNRHWSLACSSFHGAFMWSECRQFLVLYFFIFIGLHFGIRGWMQGLGHSESISVTEFHPQSLGLVLKEFFDQASKDQYLDLSLPLVSPQFPDPLERSQGRHTGRCGLLQRNGKHSGEEGRKWTKGRLHQLTSWGAFPRLGDWLC